MGKAEEIWDDSALVSAFDNAISTYKKMHGRRSGNDHSTDGGDAAVITDQSNGESTRDADEERNIAPNAAEESEDAKNLIPVQDDHHLDSVEPVNSSSGEQAQAANEHSYAQNAESYNQVLSQYYDLEEKRQRILQQLHQFGGYNYNYPVDGFDSNQQWATCCTSQDHSVPTSQPVGCSCCPYACPCSAVPCASFSACSFGGTCSGKMCDNSSGEMAPAKSVSHVDVDIVKVAMGAAERAISSVKTVSLANSGMKEKGKGKDNEEEMAQSTISETDLSVVLNAWYSAGFYTGKYLTEQATMKKQ